MNYNGFIIMENAMTSKQINLGPLTFGLDIGIASVGWAVLGGNRIIDLGVRCFDKAETAKEGESLNLARRSARLLRRRLRRRAWRLTKLARSAQARRSDCGCESIQMQNREERLCTKIILAITR